MKQTTKDVLNRMGSFLGSFSGYFFDEKGLKTGQKHRIQRIPSNPRF
jgi:hypothetical protein